MNLTRAGWFGRRWQVSMGLADNLLGHGVVSQVWNRLVPSVRHGGMAVADRSVRDALVGVVPVFNGWVRELQ